MEQISFKSACIKLFVRLLGASVGCLILSVFGFTLSSSHIVRAAIQIINMVVVISVSYPVANQLGATDSAIVKAGKRKYNAFKGLFAGLLGTCILIISNILLILSKLFDIFPSFYKYIYKFINAFYYPISFSLMSTDYTLSQTPWSDVFLCIIPVVIIPTICAFGYYFGVHRVSFGEKVFYKKIDNGVQNGK